MKGQNFVERTLEQRLKSKEISSKNRTSNSILKQRGHAMPQTTSATASAMIRAYYNNNIADATKRDVSR